MSARGSEISPATWRTLQSGFEHGLEFILPNMNADDKSLVAHQWPLNHASPMDSAHESFINDFSGIAGNRKRCLHEKKWLRKRGGQDK